MDWWRGRLPQAVLDLTDERVKRCREGDESIWDERIGGLQDRLMQPRAQRQAEPELEAE